MVGTARPERGWLSPRSLTGLNQVVSVFVDDPDALFARAKAAGAVVLQELKDEAFGSRGLWWPIWRGTTGTSAPTGRGPTGPRAPTRGSRPESGRAAPRGIITETSTRDRRNRRSPCATPKPALALVSLVALLRAPAAPAQTWKALGPPGDSVTAIAVDPKNPKTVWAGTRLGVYKSVDGAATWDEVEQGARRAHGLRPRGRPVEPEDPLCGRAARRALEERGRRGDVEEHHAGEGGVQLREPGADALRGDRPEQPEEPDLRGPLQERRRRGDVDRDRPARLPERTP